MAKNSKISCRIPRWEPTLEGNIKENNIKFQLDQTKWFEIETKNICLVSDNGTCFVPKLIVISSSSYPPSWFEIHYITPSLQYKHEGEKKYVPLTFMFALLLAILHIGILIYMIFKHIKKLNN